MRFWQSWSRRRSREAELERELRSHIDLEAEEQVDAGMAPEDARYAAQRALGNATQIKEDVRVAWGFQWLETLLQDLRYALRQLHRNPGFTAVAVVTLALGIGANTAIFSLVDAVLLRMLPVRNPEQLVRLTWVAPNSGGDEFFSYPTYELLGQYNKTLSGLIAFHSLGNVDLVTDGQAALARGQAVSGNYFTLLGVKPALGRMLLPQDDAPHAGKAVAVISYGYWTRRFDRSPSVIGAAITLNRSPVTIVGVTAPEFFGLDPGEPVDVSIPLGQVARVTPGWAATGSPYDALKAPFRNWLRLMARVRDGESQPLVLANLQPIYKEGLHQASEAIRGLPVDSGQVDQEMAQSRLQLEPGSRGLTALRREFSKPLLFLLIVVAVLLLIASTNVANLLLARASVRQKEIALRMALGAGRLRVIRQLLTESVLLSVAGGALGTLLAYWGSSSLVAEMSHSPSSIQLSVRPDARVLAFTVIVSLFSAMVFGFAPAWRISGLELSRAVKDSGQDVTSARRHYFRLGEGLVLSQVALAFILLIGSGLLVRTLEKLKDLNPGFDPQNALLFSLNPGLVGYKDAQVAQVYEKLSDRIKAMPGVRAVSYSDYSPLAARFGSTILRVEGYTPWPGENVPVNINFVSPSFFKTLRTGILLGREFTESDRIGSPKVAVVNEAMAHHFFGGSNPLGRRFSIPDWVGDASPIEIVGVAENTKIHDLREQPVPTAYMPLLQEPDAVLAVTFEVRTAANPGILAASVRRLIKQTDSRVPLFDVKTLEQVNDSLVQERAVASLSGLFGVLALFLTCVGLYGIIAYSVTRRTHEIGIRMALGAERRQVFGLVLSRGMILTFIGIGVGTVAALGLTRLMTTLLYGVEPVDPLTFVTVVLMLTGVALLACYIPARRAAKVDPMIALRHE